MAAMVFAFIPAVNPDRHLHTHRSLPILTQAQQALFQFTEFGGDQDSVMKYLFKSATLQYNKL